MTIASGDVVVVGAGPWGLAAAWGIARAGGRVTLVDDGERSAAWAAAGMLGPWSEGVDGEDDLQRLMVATADRWPEFAGELRAAGGRESGFQRCGTLHVAARPEHLGSLRRLRETLGRLGREAAWLSGSELREIEPGLGPDVGAGLHLPDEHQADPRLLLIALRAACGEAGVTPVESGARALVRDGAGIACGVELADGRRLAAGTVVVAAGWSAGRLAHRVRVRPVKGQILTLGPRPGIPAPIARVVRTAGVYLVPRPDGRIVVGATSEESSDRLVTAGAVHDLLDEALAVVPDLGELALVETVAGLRPATPDGRPALGRDPGDGIVWATGGHRHGILLAPLVADALPHLVAGKELPELAPLSPARFPPGVAACA
jgi:glycine oxidase